MRIAVVASPVTPLRPAQLGGAQAFVCDLALGLVRRGHEVTVYCAETSELEGVRLVTVPAPDDAAAALVMPGGHEPPPAPGVARALAAMFDSIAASSVDVISQHAFDVPAFELARDMPVLHTLHLPPIVASVARVVGAVSPSRLATVSASCLAEWRAAGVDVGQVLPNGVPAAPVPEFPVDRWALVAGRLSPEKGVEHAIAAARSIGLPVRVAGAHYDPAYELDLSGTEVVGSVPRDQLRSLMSRSAVTVCAVRWEEPFGMVAAEAQMAGCPVAAYRRGAMAEVVQDGLSGRLAEPDDVAALGRAIGQCLELDRAAVRASAVRRLGLDAALDRYEAALLRASR
ncbi:MAG: glycosyltransferase family 4 protein [Chloroflexi bacterium]|nr:MAG: glycosyltransferase family 4 protein [Chloroflexota bacterium]